MGNPTVALARWAAVVMAGGIPVVAGSALVRGPRLPVRFASVVPQAAAIRERMAVVERSVGSALDFAVDPELDNTKQGMSRPQPQGSIENGNS